MWDLAKGQHPPLPACPSRYAPGRQHRAAHPLALRNIPNGDRRATRLPVRGWRQDLSHDNLFHSVLGRRHQPKVYRSELDVFAPCRSDRLQTSSAVRLTP